MVFKVNQAISSIVRWINVGGLFLAHDSRDLVNSTLQSPGPDDAEVFTSTESSAMKVSGD